MEPNVNRTNFEVTRTLCGEASGMTSLDTLTNVAKLRFISDDVTSSTKGFLAMINASIEGMYVDTNLWCLWFKLPY